MTFKSLEFQATVDLAKVTFPSLKSVAQNRITSSAVRVDYPDHGLVEIGPGAWEVASIGVDTFEVGVMENGSEPGFDSAEMSAASSSAIVPSAPAAAAPPQVEEPERSPPQKSAASILTIKQMSGKTTRLAGVRLSDVVGDLKQRVWSIEGIPANKQRLIFSGKVLEDKRTLLSYGIRDLSSIFFVLFNME
ncbi:hypothetical protein FRC01_006818 [Tulasnella sp. 417]|nr:hypothetical protein FRC01_006818 [Tulasnella sp. 417]